MKIVSAISKMESKMVKAACTSRNIWEQVGDQVIAERDFMYYIGVFTFDGELVAISEKLGTNRSTNTMNSGNSREPSFNIEPPYVKAIVNHIKSPCIGMTQINIASLQFLCLRQSSGCLSGMSNFNMDNSPRSVAAADQAIHCLTGQTFTRLDAVETHHLLQLGAVLHDDLVIVGISIPGQYSGVTELRNMIKLKYTTEKYGINDTIEHHTEPITNVSGNNDSHTSDVDFDVELRVKLPSLLTQQDEVDMVELRDKSDAAASVEVVAEKDRPCTKYEEDWHTVTIRSIESLRRIGLFDNDSETDSAASSEASGDLDRRHNEGRLVDEGRQRRARTDRRGSGGKPSTTDKLQRRPSRSTMV